MSSSPGFVVLPSVVGASACLLSMLKYTGSEDSRLRLLCKATSDDKVVRLDRRDVILGLTAVGAAVTTSNLGLAMAADAGGQCAAMPIKAEVLRCVSANGFQCPGLNNPQDIVDFSSLPRPKGLPRVRKAAHLLDATYVGKFEQAVRRMKALAHDDPRSFKLQADIHEAYCASHYKVVRAGGGPETVLDVHHSSIFAPWHRMYLYFFEGILGDLIGDPTFGLPYWNWDTSEGMMMPSIFANESSPLYDAKRNPKRVRAVMDLNLSPGSKDGLPTCNDDLARVIDNNLYSLYRQVVIYSLRKY